MTDIDPVSIIEATLRNTVLPMLVYRVRAETDGELALSILEALDAGGFEIVRKAVPVAVPAPGTHEREGS